MATSLLALLDDITTILDDVALLSKLAAKKTTGVLGDDLALNAQQVTGVSAERELPVVWAVCKGSARNKAILVPAALLISAFAPWLVTPLLMAGGLFLCYEGVEKLAHKFLHSAGDASHEEAHEEALAQSVADPSVDLVALEKSKIKGAVTTDFILSAEIIAITLGAVAESPILTQVIVLVIIAIVMTIGVYGLVAGIVKLDDAGLYLSQRRGEAARKLGAGILWAAPWLMKALSVAGTVAMFLVGGGILTHGLSALHHPIEAITTSVAAAAGFASGLAHALVPAILNALFGIVAGAVTLAVVTAVKRVIGKRVMGKR